MRDCKADITTAAIALFNERGSKNVTVEDILLKANVSRRTFYEYFNSKLGPIIENPTVHSWVMSNEHWRLVAREKPGEFQPVVARSESTTETAVYRKGCFLVKGDVMPNVTEWFPLPIDLYPYDQ